MIRHYASAAEDKVTATYGAIRILLLDIETAPMTAHVWQMWDVNVGLNQLTNDWYILAWAAKWLGQDKVIYHDQSKQPLDQLEDDAVILGKLWELLDKADVVIGHNMKRFDARKINARFAAIGLPPPSPYRVIDTLQIAKAKFAFSSNKLEYLADLLNTKYKKLKHTAYPGHELWRAVMRGDKKAWREMRTYNEYDVLSLEELYMILRPWDDRHVNVNTDPEGQACPVCGSEALVKRGFRYTNAGKYQQFRCQSCGAWSRDKTNLYDKEQRKSLLVK